MAGDGPSTGIATGYYRGDNAFPYLVVFKKRAISVFNSDLQESRISDTLGCVAPDSIRVINGDVFFLSAFGWRVITDGRLLQGENARPMTLGKGDIDDIFKTSGYEKELNKSDFENMFSVYYQELDQYLTWERGRTQPIKRLTVLNLRVRDSSGFLMR